MKFQNAIIMPKESDSAMVIRMLEFVFNKPKYWGMKYRIILVLLKLNHLIIKWSQMKVIDVCFFI